MARRRAALANEKRQLGPVGAAPGAFVCNRSRRRRSPGIYLFCSVARRFRQRFLSLNHAGKRRQRTDYGETFSLIHLRWSTYHLCTPRPTCGGAQWRSKSDRLTVTSSARCSESIRASRSTTRRSGLEAAWYRHSILVFRNLAMSPEQHTEFTVRLGKPHIMGPPAGRGRYGPLTIIGTETHAKGTSPHSSTNPESANRFFAATSVRVKDGRGR